MCTATGGARRRTPRSSREESRACPHRGSPDHLVGLEEEDGGDGEAKSLGRLEVDREPKACRLLEGQVRRLRACENAIDEGAHTAEAFVLIRAIGQEAAVPHQVVKFIDGGEVLSRGELENPLPVNW